VTGSAEVSVEGPTVHCTRIVPPPPFPALLHWLTAALVVFPIGVQTVVGCVPPPAPDPLHWLMVAGVGVVRPEMLFTIRTVHVTVPPPPLPEPSHWVTEVVKAAEGVVEVLHVGGALAAPWHCRTVTVELEVPVATSRLFVIVTSQATAWPPALSVPLHWLIEAGAAASAGPAPATKNNAEVIASSRALATATPGGRTR
jgi:hypothetical protein